MAKLEAWAEAADRPTAVRAAKAVNFITLSLINTWQTFLNFYVQLNVIAQTRQKKAVKQANVRQSLSGSGAACDAGRAVVSPSS